MIYVRQDEFEFEVEGEKKVLRAGDSAYKEPNVPHGAVCLKKGKLIDVFTPQWEDFLEKLRTKINSAMHFKCLVEFLYKREK